MAVAFAIMLILLASSSSSASRKPPSGCFESIVSFGDSLADTGNDPLLHPADSPPHSALPPYGRTFFHHPTGRCSDGRLVIDFIAQSFGLPLVQPYFSGENGGRDFSNGVNFAVAGATALSSEHYEKMGIHNGGTNVALGIQWEWFEHFLATIPDGRKFLQRSLVVLGEMGGNDYGYPIGQGRSLEEIQSFAPPVIDYIGLKIQELIELGAETILVPGMPPLGCLPAYLTLFKNNSTTKDYDQKTGCLNWLNEFTMYHNELLLKKLNSLQNLNPHVVIIYGDYYNATMRFYISPDEFGFAKGSILKACCGAGGPYNYNETAPCSVSPSTSCDDPSSFASWDGWHFTEAAYRVMAQGFLEGPYTIPQIKTVCPCMSRAILQEEINLVMKILAMVATLSLNVSIL